MPFTPTHILAVVPLRFYFPRRLSFSALAIGSMVSDWRLFAPIGPSYQTTHTIPGLFTACIPLGLLLYVVYHSLLRGPIVELCPNGMRQKLANDNPPRLPLDIGYWIAVAGAIAIGASTHIFWDSFTHEGRWGTQLIPVLNSTALTLGDWTITGYKALQYSSTLIGIPCLLLLGWLWFRSAPSHSVGPSHLSSSQRTGVMIGLFSLTLFAGLWPIVRSLSSMPTFELFKQAIVDGVILSGGVFSLSVCLYCVVFRLAFGR